MPNNLGEIDKLSDGLNGLYIFVESYKKIKSVTRKENYQLDTIVKYYEENLLILKNLKKKFKDLQ